MTEWKKYRLKDIASLSNGINFDKSAYSSGIKLIGVADFKNRMFPDYSSLQEVDPKVVRDSDLLEYGDIVFVRSNGNKELVGRCMMVDKTIPITFSGFCIRLRVNDKEQFDPVFLNYLFKSKHFRRIMSGTAVGANIQNLSQSRLGDCEVAIPDIATQQRIAEVLSRYDSLIENYQRQIKLLEEAAQRLYKEWFVDLRFPGHESTPIINNLPEGWEKIRITDCDLFRFAKCRIEPFVGVLSYYATADVDGTYFVNAGTPIEYESKPSRAQIQPSKNSVWFARMSNSYKIIPFGRNNEHRRINSILSSGFAGFDGPYEVFSYLYCLISSKWFNDQKDSFATGATQVSLTNEGLSKIKFISPKREIVFEFSKRANALIEQILLLREKSVLVSEARDRLLPKLMNGEIEV